MTAQLDVIVIGTGVAGLTAAGLTQRAGLATAMIEAHLFGGLVTNVNELDGPIHGSGAEYAAGLMSAACDLGAENVSATVTAIEPDSSGFRVTTDAGSHATRAVIVARGRGCGISGFRASPSSKAWACPVAPIATGRSFRARTWWSWGAETPPSKRPSRSPDTRAGSMSFIAAMRSALAPTSSSGWPRSGM